MVRIYCRKCAAAIKSGVNFCPSCGFAVEVASGGIERQSRLSQTPLIAGISVLVLSALFGLFVHYQNVSPPGGVHQTTQSGPQWRALVTNAVLAYDVTSGREPARIASVFPSSVPAIYCVFEVHPAARGHRLRFRVIHEMDGDRLIREDSNDIPSNLPENRLRNFYEIRYPEGGGWPPGRYRLLLDIDGSTEKELYFTIEPG